MTGQFCLDANVFIAAWNEFYPEDVFVSFWEKLLEHRKKIILIKPIYDEIEPFSSAKDKKLSPSKKRKKYPLRMWVMENDFLVTFIDNSTEECSLSLEHKYKINDGPKGANKNDIKLIAYAKVMGKIVVTMEKLQIQNPKEKSNYKIPLICNQENVQCISLVEMLQKLGVRV